MFRRKAPPTKPVLSGVKLRKILDLIDQDNIFVSILDQIEVLTLAIQERASRLCPKDIDLNHYENNPARDIVGSCGEILSTIGFLRVDCSCVRKVNHLEEKDEIAS